jgi:hypothetical protein
MKGKIKPSSASSRQKPPPGATFRPQKDDLRLDSNNVQETRQTRRGLLLLFVASTPQECIALTSIGRKANSLRAMVAGTRFFGLHIVSHCHP